MAPESIEQNRLKQYGTIALIMSALLWGGEFVVEKDVLSCVEPNWSNAIRFFISSIFCLVVWRKEFRQASFLEWKKGIISGGLMGLGFAFQTMGLEYIGAGVNAFLSAAYVLVIPFLLWVAKKSRPVILVFVSAVLAIIGVLFMSASDMSFGEMQLGKGEILTLIGSVCYAGGIVSVDCYAADMDSKLMAGIQFIVTFVISIVFALCFERIPQDFSGKLAAEFIYLIVFSSLLAQLLFTYGMKYVSSGKAGIIFLLESVSALFLGDVFLSEKILITHIIGGILIISAIVLQDKAEKQKTDG